MATTLRELGITPEKIRTYDQRIPRYTSYPTAPYWKEEVDQEVWSQHLERAPKAAKPLSLYVHIPFCGKRCYFCGCNVIITRKAGVSNAYLDILAREVELVKAKLATEQPVVQLHLGGGTPNYLSQDEMSHMIGMLKAAFPFEPDAELSIEVDPRIATPDYIRFLHDVHGFNRISFGVQDFSAEVQESIGREQTRDITFVNVETARKVGFKSVNIDLIYGLPKQTLESWRQTIDDICELRPDRIALYNFAFLPDKLRNQKFLDPSLLPESADKLRMFVETHDRLTREGWEFIGMDHYALKDDSLNQARNQGTLRRNFMGYTTLRGTDLLSFGVSSISDYQGAFGQNVKKLSTYKNMILNGELPIERGMILSDEDRVRQYMIEELMCNGYLSFESTPEGLSEKGEGIRRRVFEQEDKLVPLRDDDLISWDEKGLSVTEKGRMFLRNIAVVFDTYLSGGDRSPVFSRAV